jgi:hypothetical protein|tara:strand:+ start:25 stop:282 length:258 start_codon:yes stop_codon:yes gene_type:complete
MGKKLTEKELTQVQSMLNAFNQLKMQLGDIELTKGTIIDKVNVLKVDYSKVEKALSKKYGKDSQIDVATGEITVKQKEANLEKVK